MPPPVLPRSGPPRRKPKANSVFEEGREGVTVLTVTPLFFTAIPIRIVGGCEFSDSSNDNASRGVIKRREPRPVMRQHIRVRYLNFTVLTPEIIPARIVGRNQGRIRTCRPA
ncbi:MAG: hypothetical protein H7145_11715 [Akkermansiaceae bacterium]|nr:hypothetical protein [Armatimonadota bacterium]